MEIATQQQRHALVMKDGLESDAKYQIALVRLTALEGAFATVHLMFQSVRTALRVGWAQIVINLACMGCSLQWTVEIVIVNRDGLELVVTANVPVMV